ncbi:MAG: FecR domain-containing protein [Acidobacteria bacterium]|nr:FecR domain-containing protein [Acidobacteriota bacterium]
MKLGAKTLLTTAALTFGALAALAQPVISAKSGLVSKSEGEVYLGDKPIEDSQANFPEVKENQVLSTKQGRAEILLTRGVVMRMGENAAFKMFTNRLIDTRLEVLSGSAIVEAAEMVKDNNLTILAGDATVTVTKHGLYRFDMAANSIKVFDGMASVTLNGQTTLVGQGRLLRVQNGQPVIEKFNKDDTDALDNWSRRRAEQVARANPSSAKQVYDSGCGGMYGTQWASPVGPYDPNNPCSCGGWRYNPWYGLITYIPCGANIYSPYGYRYWGPMNVMQAYYIPPQPSPGYYGGGGGGGNYFPSMGNTAGGYAGAMSSSSPGMVSSAPAAAATTGTTSSASAGSSSAGHGASGGHGK